eukprot:6303081-Prymnesium_polylepis.1
MQRTLKRELKVPETAKGEAKAASTRQEVSSVGSAGVYRVPSGFTWAWRAGWAGGADQAPLATVCRAEAFPRK